MLRDHRVVQSSGGALIAADRKLASKSRVTIHIEGDQRVIEANGIPRHHVGAFPNPANPNVVSAQRYRFTVPLRPRIADHVTPGGLTSFGVALNGVPFDPGAAEWFMGQPHSPWAYEPLSGAVPLGIDDNMAHVQPSGAYHYHGLPHGLLAELGVASTARSPLVGWAADGFPIYALYAADGGDVVEQRSSYRLRRGERPQGAGNPGGTYDGTFVADYEFVEGLGTLDRCNGRKVATPELPEGGYAYFLTRSFPVIPRCFTGAPDRSFAKHGPPPPPRR